MKRYVTGYKHFRDPVLETEYKRFVSQSDKVRYCLLQVTQDILL